MHTTPLPTQPDKTEAYLARCLKTLKACGAPTHGWECIGMVDYETPGGYGFSCRLCGCTKVRFGHIMTHPHYPTRFEVGCICAGVMEGNELAARERERSMRNRSKRRKTFLKKGLQPTRTGNFKITRKGRTIFINRGRQPGTWYLNTDGTRVFQWHGKPITRLETAQYAAFDLIDPPVGQVA